MLCPVLCFALLYLYIYCIFCLFYFLLSLTDYYYYYAAFNAPCVGHNDDESNDVRSKADISQLSRPLEPKTKKWKKN